MTLNKKLIIIFIAILISVTLTTWVALYMAFDMFVYYVSILRTFEMGIPDAHANLIRSVTFSGIVAFSLLGTHCATSYFLVKKIIVLKGRMNDEYKLAQGLAEQQSSGTVADEKYSNG